MTVLILTTGTHGDIAPFIGLGRRLRESGFPVAIATYAAFAEQVRASGAEFRRLTGDPSRLGVAEQGRLKKPGPGDTLRAGRWLKNIAQHVEELSGDLVAAARQGADLLLCCGLTTFHGYHLAKALGIPSMGLALQPLHPTGDFPPPIGTPSLGRRANRALGQLMFTTGLTPWRSSPRFCRELGVPALTTAQTLRQTARERWPVHYGFSPTVVRRPADWRPGIEVVGYWWPHEPPGWQPPQELVDFLDAGPEPVRVGLGSGGDPRDRAEISALLATALRKAGVRGIVQSGWAGLEVTGDDILTLGDVPHRWLFPRTAAVVHHVGAGTTGAGLRAGVPAVTLPTFGDAPFWARRLVALGASPGYLPLNKAAPDQLARLIRAAVDRPGYRTRSRQLAATLAAEDGAGRTVATVQRLLDPPRPHRPTTIDLGARTPEADHEAPGG
ncbi:glycosyltransferase [Streptomyces sp. NPDC057555]|uniref:glycosyltransferase n=1 Tax=Streptomyces sp. NPDC057555 TaxID=3346166 RepID=UPI0036922CB7